MVKTHGGRWLVVSQYYPPEIGAPQIRLRAMVKELRKHGIEVEVLTALPNYPAGEIFPEYKGKRRVREEIDGIPVTRTWVYPGTGKSAFVRLRNYFSFTMTAMWAALRGPRPDVLFVESQPMSLGETMGATSRPGSRYGCSTLGPPERHPAARWSRSWVSNDYWGWRQHRTAT